MDVNALQNLSCGPAGELTGWLLKELAEELLMIDNPEAGGSPLQRGSAPQG